MAQIMVEQNNNYQNRIYFLRSHGDILLNRIKMLEIKMNRMKQRNQEANERDINLLAEINTYQYFQLTNEPFMCVNDNYFNQIRNNYFEYYIRRFITQLRLKRIRRLQILQYQQSLRINNLQPVVDFKIWP